MLCVINMYVFMLFVIKYIMEDQPDADQNYKHANTVNLIKYLIIFSQFFYLQN